MDERPKATRDRCVNAEVPFVEDHLGKTVGFRSAHVELDPFDQQTVWWCQSKGWPVRDRSGTSHLNREDPDRTGLDDLRDSPDKLAALRCVLIAAPRKKAISLDLDLVGTLCWIDRLDGGVQAAVEIMAPHFRNADGQQSGPEI